MSSSGLGIIEERGALISSLAEDLEQLLEWLSGYGKQESGGVTRLLYSEAWKEAQQALAERMRVSGLVPSFDQVGNLYGRLEGTGVALSSILTGSHVDTVKNGGLYDGAFGIAAGIVALDYLKKHFGAPRRSLEVVSFCEEEGSRFPIAYWGSGSVTGRFKLEDAAGVADMDGVRLEDAMRQAGFGAEGSHAGRGAAGPSKAERRDIAAFVEIHVEQGIVLEREQLQIGVVEAIVGQQRYTVTVTGEANHAGTTPMVWRKDAMRGASKMINWLLDAAAQQGAPLVATAGYMEVRPNVTNVIPREVAFTVDVRHTDERALELFCSRFRCCFEEIAASLGLGLHIKHWMDTSPVYMDEQLTRQVEQICERNGIAHRRMVSGAGHDVQELQSICPSAMIFVPSRAGISHSPLEHTDSLQLAEGTVVLIELLYQLAYGEGSL
ncbi:allantoate deiminase [Paenibacillus algorifonticola]|uniref:Allantoate deiminase n=1 Tax=Paenibacillus algorifonticola TaxID=684063 RepID=A0A1I2H8M5_9BACL|nr:allantoate deiminase [Paenibacillus algorifonticola]SFF25086.1 allantoate deiminase [Paenibacillus algorifonticola]